MGIFTRRNRHIKYELVHRQNAIYEITDVAIEAHTAIGTERQAAAQQVHETLQTAQQMIAEAGSRLSPERKQALIYRQMAYCYEVLDITNRTAMRLIEKALR